MKEIKLDVSKVKFPSNQKPVALCDDEDYEFLNGFKWYAVKKGKSFHAETDMNGKKVLMENMVIWLSQFENNEPGTDVPGE